MKFHAKTIAASLLAALALDSRATTYLDTTGDLGATSAAAAIPTANMAVLRAKADILRRSTLGAMFTHRTATPGRTGANEAYGVDTVLSFFQNVRFDGYVARKEAPDFLAGGKNVKIDQLTHEMAVLKRWKFGGRSELYEINYLGSNDLTRLQNLWESYSLGEMERMKHLVDKCMGEYDINGWTVPDLINNDDVSVLRRP